MATVAQNPAEAAPKAKRQKVTYQETFPSAEEAVKAAETRVKGPRRAFKVTVPATFPAGIHGKTFYVVHNNEGRASGVVGLTTLGLVVEELGKVRKAKLTGVDGIMAAVNALPEAEKKSVLEALKALAGKK